jgi:hypothetical protein
MKTNRHSLYYNLYDALAQTGCPICRLSAQGLERYLAHLLYECVNDLDVRESIRLSQGFCQEHAWRMQARGDPLGIAIIHQDILTNILRALSGERPREAGSLTWAGLAKLMPRAVTDVARRLADRVAPLGRCPACQKRDEIERAYLDTLIQHLSDQRLLSRLRNTDGLCWDHFRCALQLVHDEPTLDLLVEIEVSQLQDLRDELAEFIRHHDYHWSDSRSGPEGDSWIRAVAKVSGEPTRLRRREAP